MVRREGIEPSRIAARDFKSLASTYFATGAGRKGGTYLVPVVPWIAYAYRELSHVSVCHGTTLKNAHYLMFPCLYQLYNGDSEETVGILKGALHSIKCARALHSQVRDQTFSRLQGKSLLNPAAKPAALHALPPT